jgi:hypothetical protein
MTERKIFSREFKLEAIRLMESGQKKSSDLARELGVPRSRGIHTCAGLPLARAEARITMERFFGHTCDISYRRDDPRPEAGAALRISVDLHVPGTEGPVYKDHARIETMIWRRLI